MLNKYLLVAAGGGMGSMARFALCNFLPSIILTNFPLQILVVNILGCGAMGTIIEYLSFASISNQEIKLFITAGFLGGFTTFSSFISEVGLLNEKNLHTLSIIYTIIGVIGSISAFYLGAKSVRIFVS